MRVAVVQTHPIQYFSPLWSALAASPDVSLKVFYLSAQGSTTYHDAGFGRSVAWDLALLDGHDHMFVPNLPASAQQVAGFFSLRNTALWSALSAFSPDVCLVLGYEHFAKWIAYAWCAAHRVPYVIRGESNNMMARGTARSIVKRAVLTPLYSRASAVAAIGRLNAEYSVAFGAHPARVVVAPYSVDDARFSAARSMTVAATRRHFGLPERGVFMIVSGKLVDRKRPLLTLRAFSQISASRRDVHLVYLGDGLLRADVEREAARLGVRDRVHVLGFVNQGDAPLAYRACDVLVFPSAHDTWGVVVNEAMHAGLPVIVSDRVGAAADLVTGHDAGIVVPVDDEAALVAAMRAMIEDESLRRRFSEGALRRAGEWTISATVRGLREAFQRAQAR